MGGGATSKRVCVSGEGGSEGWLYKAGRQGGQGGRPKSVSRTARTETPYKLTNGLLRAAGDARGRIGIDDPLYSPQSLVCLLSVSSALGAARVQRHHGTGKLEEWVLAQKQNYK